MINDKLEQFEELCKEHDLTYSYADDYRDYVRGKHSYNMIMELSEQIPYYEARNIWNKYVMEKLNVEYVEEYLWK
jgi:hypothetical protein